MKNKIDYMEIGIITYEVMVDNGSDRMSKVTIPLKWSIDLIHIPNTKNEYLLIEWFEEKECKTKTILFLGKYMRVRQYQINEINYSSNKNMTLDLLENKLNMIKLGEYVEENGFYCPLAYKRLLDGGHLNDA